MNDYENNIDINNRGMYIAGSLSRYYPLSYPKKVDLFNK